jgi:hypothetical protein
MSLHIVTVATNSQYYSPYLVESCERNGLKLEILGFGEEWKGFNWKYKKMIDYLKTLPKNDLVCFVDGYDIICCRNLKEMPAVFYELKEKHKCKIIYAEDKLMFIFSIFVRFYFGTCKNKSLNSGTYIGSVNDLLEILPKIYNLDNRDNADDQILTTKYCEQNPNELFIDTENKLFLTLQRSLQEIDQYVDINKETKQLTYKSNSPFFVHAPGYGYLDGIIEKLGYDIEPGKIKNQLFSYFIEKKVWLYTKTILVEYFYIFLFIFIILFIVILKVYYKIKIFRVFRGVLSRLNIRK